MMEFAPNLALGALVLTLVNTLRYARAGDFNGVITQCIAWASGVASVMLAAQTDFADAIAVGGITLGATNAWSQVFLGVTAAATGSTVVEALKAVDKFQTAAKPPLLPNHQALHETPPAPPQ